MRSAVTPQDVMRALRDSGVEVVRLDVPAAADDLEADVLVPRNRRRLAARTLDGLDWRFDVGNRGVWRLTRHASYGWDHGLVIHLHSGIPAAPLPSRALARLERLVWQRAGGIDAPLDPAVQLAVAAVQVARPQPRRGRWARAVADAASRIEDWSGAADVARRAGVAGSVRRASARSAPERVPAGADSVADRAWVLARRVQRRIGRRRLEPLFTGIPLLGRSVRRCRFAGIEVVAGPGVFRPMEVTEHMVDAAVEAIPDGAPVPVVEVGTGCGAVALAIAARRQSAEIHASEVSAACLRSARRNRRALGARVDFHRGSLLQPFPPALERRVAVITGNVPYVPPERARAATADTPGAILGAGEDGLGLVRRLSADARRFLRPGGTLVLQMLETQWETFAGELAASGYRPGGVVARRGPHVVATATLP